MTHLSKNRYKDNKNFFICEFDKIKGQQTGQVSLVCFNGVFPAIQYMITTGMS